MLRGGAVQEEIRFAIAPELLAGLVVSPRMEPREAIVLRGSEQFAATAGYATSLQFAGDFIDPCPRLADGTPDSERVAIDAADYRRGDPAAQYTEAATLRELDKARAGFLRDGRNLPVATGNWGCGVFLGDPVHKAVIQWLAASAEGRATRYYTFADQRLGDLVGFVGRASHLAVGELARRLLAARGTGTALYDQLFV